GVGARDLSHRADRLGTGDRSAAVARGGLRPAFRQARRPVRDPRPSRLAGALAGAGPQSRHRLPLHRPLMMDRESRTPMKTTETSETSETSRDPAPVSLAGDAASGLRETPSPEFGDADL